MIFTMFQNKEHNVYDIDYGSASMFHWGIPKWNKIAVRTVGFTADNYLIYCSKPAKRSKSKRIKQEYPHINYAVVLAYMPGKKTEYDGYSYTMLSEGIVSAYTPTPGRRLSVCRKGQTAAKERYQYLTIDRAQNNASQERSWEAFWLGWLFD